MVKKTHFFKKHILVIIYVHALTIIFEIDMIYDVHNKLFFKLKCPCIMHSTKRMLCI